MVMRVIGNDMVGNMFASCGRMWISKTDADTCVDLFGLVKYDEHGLKNTDDLVFFHHLHMLIIQNNYWIVYPCILYCIRNILH